MVVGLVEDAMAMFDIGGGMDGVVDPDHHHQ